MNGPGANYDPVLMDGSNHLQMKNDSNTKDAIKAIFEDGLDQGNPNAYFKTDKRQSLKLILFIDITKKKLNLPSLMIIFL